MVLMAMRGYQSWTESNLYYEKDPAVRYAKEVGYGLLRAFSG